MDWVDINDELPPSEPWPSYTVRRHFLIRCEGRMRPQNGLKSMGAYFVAGYDFLGLEDEHHQWWVPMRDAVGNRVLDEDEYRVTHWARDLIELGGEL